MIKVLFFLPNLGGGGAEKVLVNLVNNLNKENFNITLLTLFDDGKNKMYLDSNIEYKYIFKKSFRGNIHLFKIFSPDNLYSMFIKDYYDIVISYLQGPTTRILSGSKDPNVIKINWIHTDLNEKKLLKAYRSIKEFKKVYSSYDCTVFVSENSKESFEKIIEPHNPHYVKYNTIDSELIRLKSLEYVKDISIDRKKMNVMTIGRLIDVKGYIRLLRIINKIKDKYNNFHLYILGEGKLKPSMQKYIEQQNLAKYVTLLGYKENPYKYLREADLFVCSSYREGFSTAVTESLILGIPVITTLCSGMKELLGNNNEYGVIVDNNEESLYTGMMDLLVDKNKLTHYRKQAKKRGKYFSKDKTVDEIEKLLFNLYYKNNSFY